MSVTVTVIDVLTGERFSFCLGARTTFNVNHLKHEVEQFYPRDDTEEYRLIFIRDGVALNEDDYILPENVVEGSYVDFYMVAQPRCTRNTKFIKPTRIVDEASMVAAQEWMKSAQHTDPAVHIPLSSDPLFGKQYELVSNSFNMLNDKTRKSPRKSFFF
jgi:hypothetical protein